MAHHSFFIIDFPKLVSLRPLIAIELAMAFTSRTLLAGLITIGLHQQAEQVRKSQSFWEPSVEEIGDQVFNARSTVASRSS